MPIIQRPNISCGVRYIYFQQGDTPQSIIGTIKESGGYNIMTTYVFVMKKKTKEEHTIAEELINYIKENKLGTINESAPMQNNPRAKEKGWYKAWIWTATPTNIDNLLKL